MTTCNGQTPYEAVPIIDMNDLLGHKTRRAKILDINRFTGLAEIEYDPDRDHCDVAGFPTNNVPFFYHCEWSTGTAEDLAAGHLAFIPDDVVYVVMIPDNFPHSGRAYIVGHYDLRATNPCGTEWVVMSMGAENAPTCFVIIDLVTGNLYDGWPEIEWPIWVHRGWDLPINNNVYKIDQYRTWRSNRKHLVYPINRDAWRFIEWDFYYQEYVCDTHIDEWELYTVNQFRVGFSWRPGAEMIDGSGVVTTTTGPTVTGTLGQGGGSDRIVGPANQLYCYHSWSGGDESQLTESTYDRTAPRVYGQVDMYVLNTNCYPDYISEHPSVIVDLPDSIGSSGSYTVSDLIENYKYELITDNHYDPTKRYDITIYSRYWEKTTTVKRGVHNTMFANTWINYPYNGTSLSKPFSFIYQNDEVVWDASKPMEMTTTWTKQLDPKGETAYGFCWGTHPGYKMVQTINSTITFRMSAPWKADFFEGSVSLEGEFVQKEGYGFDMEGLSFSYGWMKGHPIFMTGVLLADSGTFDLVSNMWYSTPFLIHSTCMANGLYGAWGLTVCAYFSTNMDETCAAEFWWGDGDPTAPSLIIRPEESLVVKATIGFSHSSKHTSAADVHLTDLKEREIPKGITDAIRLMILDGWWVRNAPSFRPPNGTLNYYTQLEPESMHGSAVGEINIFPVTITPPPAE